MVNCSSSDRAKRLSLMSWPVSERHLASRVDHGRALTGDREMETISGRRPFQGAAVGAGGVAALTAAAPGSSAASAGPLASRFGRPRFPNWRRLIGTAGPGLLIAGGYVDPGNWATDLGGGSRYGYALLSMGLIPHLIALVTQALCVRLPLPPRQSPPAVPRAAHSPPGALPLRLPAEGAVVAAALAEPVGGALAL